MRRSVLFAACASLATAAPVAAQDVAADVRCVIASNVFANTEKDPQRKQLAIASLFFYSGRLDARLTPAQLKPQMEAQGKALRSQDIGAVMTACAQRLAVQQRRLQEMGKQIDAAQARK